MPNGLDLPGSDHSGPREVLSLTVLAHGHSVYVGIIVLMLDVQSNLGDVHVIRY